MPTIFEAKMDGSEAIRYFHFPLTGFYLGIARRNAQVALTATDEQDAMRGTFIAITFAAMCVEAFCNERAEDVIQISELTEFNNLSKRFSGQPLKSSVVAKAAILLVEKKYVALPTDVLQALERLFYLRNKLVHYKLSETAGKYVLPPLRSMPVAGGGAMWSIDFTQKPTKTIPPLLQEITPQAAKAGHNAAFDLIHHWLQSAGSPEEMAAFPRLE